MLNTKNLIRILVNSVLGIVLITFWLNLVDIQAIARTLSKINPWMLPLPIICFATAGFLRGLRLKILLAEYKLPVLKLWFLTMLGQLLSFTIPIRVGEVAKGAYLSTNYNIGFGKSVVWVFMDRFIDFWFTAMLALLLIILIPTQFPSNLKPLLTIVVLTFTISTFLLLYFPKRVSLKLEI